MISRYRSTGTPWMCCGRRKSVAGAEGAVDERRAGWSLIEAAVGLMLVAVILLGVTATLTTAAIGHRATTSRVESQMLLNQVLEEIQASPYDTLLSFHGTYVVEGNYRADISAALADVHLVAIQVGVTSPADPTVSMRGVLMVADRE